MNQMSRHHKKSGLLRIMIPVTVLILLVCLAIILVITRNDNGANVSSETAAEAPDYDHADKWSEGIITYNGEDFRYNNKIRTYLFMGIDTDEPVHKAVDGISGGQADALFLLAVDKAKSKLSVVSIHRNTMTSVKTYNSDGEYTGDVKLQICLQHGYGDGERLSCQRTADCVSELFYGILINGYMSLNMGGIGLLNDALGGVELTVMQNIDNEQRGVHLRSGETKVLSGDEAYAYVRSRDISEFDSASDRLTRQEQYLNAMLPVMLNKIRSASSAVSIYEKAEDYIYSNIDYSRLADEISGMSYNESQGIYDVPGKAVMGETYEEFYVDDDGLYQLILGVFYDKVS